MKKGTEWYLTGIRNGIISHLQHLTLQPYDPILVSTGLGPLASKVSSAGPQTISHPLGALAVADMQLEVAPTHPEHMVHVHHPESYTA